MDWVKFGFGPDYLEYSRTLPFYVNYNNARRSTIPAFDLYVQAVRRIVEQYPKPYTLICSGGVDSQAMILAWLQARVPFDVVTARYNGGMNDHDLENLWLLQKRENFAVRVLDLDVLYFHENDLIDYAVKYDCTSPQVLTHMLICDQINRGTIVSSGCLVTKNGMHGANNYVTFGLHRYSKITGKSMVPFFWMHDIDMMPVFEEVRKSLGIKIEDVVDQATNYDTKCRIYQGAGLDVIPQDLKYNGFEKIKEYYDQFPLDYKTRVLTAGNISQRNYDLRFRYLLERYARPTSYSSVTDFD